MLCVRDTKRHHSQYKKESECEGENKKKMEKITREVDATAETYSRVLIYTVAGSGEIKKKRKKGKLVVYMYGEGSG